MTPGFVIGNGISRKKVDLNKLPGTTYGCNWLYTEFTPDVLVATDGPISKHIQDSNYSKYHKFYTRKAYSSTGARELQPKFKNWASGPNAVQLAVLAKHTEITLLGFDFGGCDNTYNNMYAGTKFYKHPNSKSTYAGSWQSQLSKIFKASDWVKFKIAVGPETSKSVYDFEIFDNVEIISIYKLMNM